MMKRATLNHPKTHALATAMGSTRRDALGLLTLLWDFTGQYAPTGTIGHFTNAAIADAVDWEGNPDELVGHLVQSGWIDEVDDQSERLLIHHWSDHCEQWVRKRLQREGLSFYTANSSSTIHPERPSIPMAPERPDEMDGPPMPMPMPMPSPSKKKSPLLDFRLDPSVDTPEVRSALADWVRYRKQRKPALTAMTIKRLPARILKMGAEQFIAAVAHTIDQGWTGLREPEQVSDSPTESIADRMKHLEVKRD